MAADSLYIDSLPGETRIAWVENGRLSELEIVRAGRESLVGNVYLGRVEKIAAGIQSAFVDIGLGQSGFLSLKEAGETTAVTEGARLIVQVAKDPVAGKGAKLTARIGLPGRYLVHMPLATRVRLSRRIGPPQEAARLTALLAEAGLEGGYILRTAAMGAGRDDLLADAAATATLWERIRRKADGARPPLCLHAEPPPVHRVLRAAVEAGVGRIVFDSAEALAEARAFVAAAAPSPMPRLDVHAGSRPLFEAAAIEEQIEAALQPVVLLPSGGNIVIEETAALTAVDVNTGAAGRDGGAGRGGLLANKEAAAEIGRQIRLRNIAGQVVIDFLPMRGPAAGAEVLRILKEALADDRCPSQVVGFTRLGLVEMTRERRRPSLRDILSDARPAAGIAKAPLTVAFDILRRIPSAVAAAPGRAIGIKAPASAIAALHGPAAEARLRLEARLGRPLVMTADDSLLPDQFDIAPLARQREKGHG